MANVAGPIGQCLNQTRVPAFRYSILSIQSLSLLHYIGLVSCVTELTADHQVVIPRVSQAMAAAVCVIIACAV